MTEPSRTATTRQGVVIVGIAILLGIVLAISVFPTFRPPRSRLVGMPAPGFTLPVMTGGEPGSRVSLSDYRGKVVAIDFWASWCAPCRAEAPILDRLSRKYAGKGVVFLGVATGGDDWSRAVQFVKSVGIGYPTLFDDGDHVGSAFLVKELPTFVVVDASGQVTASVSRMMKEGDIDDLVTKALAP